MPLDSATCPFCEQPVDDHEAVSRGTEDAHQLGILRESRIASLKTAALCMRRQWLERVFEHDRELEKREARPPARK